MLWLPRLHNTTAVHLPAFCRAGPLETVSPPSLEACHAALGQPALFLSVPASQPLSQATAGHMWQAHCLLSASVQQALMFMCCRPQRRTAGCLTAQACPVHSSLSGQRPCHHCQDRWAGHLGWLSARWLLRSSLPLARWVCRACTLSSASSACRAACCSSSVQYSVWLVLQHGARVDQAAWAASSKSVPLLCS